MGTVFTEGGCPASAPTPCHAEELHLPTAAAGMAVAGLHRTDLKQALDLMRQQWVECRDPAAPSALDGLRRQLPVLEAAFLRCLEDSTHERGERRQMVMKAGLQAQQAYARTLALLLALESQRQHSAPVLVEHATDSAQARA